VFADDVCWLNPAYLLKKTHLVIKRGISATHPLVPAMPHSFACSFTQKKKLKNHPRKFDAF